MFLPIAIAGLTDTIDNNIITRGMSDLNLSSSQNKKKETMFTINNIKMNKNGIIQTWKGIRLLLYPANMFIIENNIT
jgi:hypothetical protein